MATKVITVEQFWEAYRHYTQKEFVGDIYCRDDIEIAITETDAKYVEWEPEKLQTVIDKVFKKLAQWQSSSGYLIPSELNQAVTEVLDNM